MVTCAPIRAPSISAERKWIPPQTRALMTSVSACEKPVKCLVVPDASLNALKAMSSRWKKVRNIDMEAPEAQAWPEV